MPESLVIIPTYNEIENIERMLDTVMSLERPFDVLIVDDGSPDGTRAIIENMQTTNSSLFLLNRNKKGGLGTAYCAGFKWAIEKGYTKVVYAVFLVFS